MKFRLIETGLLTVKNNVNEMYNVKEEEEEKEEGEEEEEEEEEEVPLFTIHSFIHITYYIITRQEIKQASKLKKSKSKCSFSRQVKRLDGSKALESY